MATLGGTLFALAAAALALLLLFYLYGLIFRAFEAVGFTRREATIILLGTAIGGLFNIPIATVGEWTLAINIGGAVVPLIVAWLLLRRYPGIIQESLVGITVVALVTWLVTDVTPEGIVSIFPLWLLPPLAAAAISMLSFWREEAHSAPLAYISGTVGALVGADVFRLGEFLAQPAPTAGAVASIGGAAVFDMVFLAGILAVALDMLVFRERRRAGLVDEVDGPVVFRTTTSSDFIRDYTPSFPGSASRSRPRAPSSRGPGPGRPK